MEVESYIFLSQVYLCTDSRNDMLSFTTKLFSHLHRFISDKLVKIVIFTLDPLPTQQVITGSRNDFWSFTAGHFQNQ